MRGDRRCALALAGRSAGNCVKTVAFANRKGGTGKTTSAANMAASLADRGHRVVLIDLDPQANATTALGIARAAQGSGSEALLAGAEPEQLLEETALPRLAVLPAGSDLAGAEIELPRTEGWQALLRKRIPPLAEKHDIAVVDCPPAIGPLTVNALAAASGVVVPLQCDYFSLEGLAEFASNIGRLRTAHNPKLMLYGLLKTMYDPRTLLARQVAEQLDRHFGSKVFRTAIPRTVRLAEAPSHGLPISRYAPASQAAAAYSAAADELLEMME